jgi:hypothetical protein
MDQLLSPGSEIVLSLKHGRGLMNDHRVTTWRARPEVRDAMAAMAPCRNQVPEERGKS